MYMKRLLLLLVGCLLVLYLQSCSDGSSVYVCTGSSSSSYHKTSGCTGLSNCSKSIIEVSKSEAEAQGRNPCRICYK